MIGGVSAEGVCAEGIEVGHIPAGGSTFGGVAFGARLTQTAGPPVRPRHASLAVIGPSCTPPAVTPVRTRPARALPAVIAPRCALCWRSPAPSVRRRSGPPCPRPRQVRPADARSVALGPPLGARRPGHRAAHARGRVGEAGRRLGRGGVVEGAAEVGEVGAGGRAFGRDRARGTTVARRPSRPVATAIATGHPAVEGPATRRPATEDPTTDRPATGNPITGRPATRRPAVSHTALDAPALGTPAHEAPVGDGPVRALALAARLFAARPRLGASPLSGSERVEGVVRRGPGGPHAGRGGRGPRRLLGGRGGGRRWVWWAWRYRSVPRFRTHAPPVSSRPRARPSVRGPSSWRSTPVRAMRSAPSRARIPVRAVRHPGAAGRPDRFRRTFASLYGLPPAEREPVGAPRGICPERPPTLR